MASVNEKRKAAGTGGGKRSAPGATYSRNKTVGRDTTPQVARAYENLSIQQKQASSSLGLTKAQALQLNERQAANVNNNINRYSEAQKAQLRTMYSNVSNDQAIRSGSSGLSKMEIQEYKQAQSQKSFGSVGTSGSGVTVKQAPKFIQRGSAESRVSNLSKFNAQTQKWEIPTSTLNSLEGNVKTQGDWNAVINAADNALFRASAAEKARIYAARKYALSHSSNPDKMRQQFAQVDIQNTAKTPLTGAMSYEVIKAVKAARAKILAKYPDQPENEDERKKGVAYKDNVQAYFNYIDTVGLSTARDATLTGFMSTVTQPFKTKSQVKQEALDKELNKFAGDSAVKGVIADIYNATKDYESLKKSSAKVYNKAEKSVASVTPIHYLDEKAIEKVRTQVGKSLGITKEQEAITKYINNNPVLSESAKFARNKYETVRNKPIKATADLAKLYAEGVLLGGVFKGAGVLTRGVVKAGIGTKAATATAKSLKIPVLKNTPHVNKLALQHLPMCVADSYFIIGITDALAGGASVNGKAQEMPGLSSVYSAYKAGDKINFVTERNLNTVGSLAVMGTGLPKGVRAFDKTVRKAKAIELPSGINRLIRDESATIGQYQIEKPVVKTAQKMEMQYKESTPEIDLRDTVDLSKDLMFEEYNPALLEPPEPMLKTRTLNAESKTIMKTQLKTRLSTEQKTSLTQINKKNIPAQKLKTQQLTKLTQKERLLKNQLDLKVKKVSKEYKVIEVIKDESVQIKKLSETIKIKQKSRTSIKAVPIVAQVAGVSQVIKDLQTIKSESSAIPLVTNAVSSKMRVLESAKLTQASSTPQSTAAETVTKTEIKAAQKNISKIAKVSFKDVVSILEDPVVPPYLRKKLIKGTVTKKEVYGILKGHRIIKNKLGSFDSILGTSSKPTKKRRKTSSK
jgi:hypothetical protein